MPRNLIIVAVVSIVGLTAHDLFAQRQISSGAANQRGFQVGGRSSQGGQGSAGSFGVGTAGQVDTNARFMRNNRQGEFVGADSGDTSFVGAVASESGRQTSSRNIRRGGGGASRANVNRSSGRGRQRDQVRIVLQLGFTPPKSGTIAPSRTPQAVASRLAERMEKSSWIQNQSPLEVSIDDGTATLRGVVATEHDRLLAERLALLEGGVRKVENQLKIQGADSPEAPALLQPMP